MLLLHMANRRGGGITAIYMACGLSCVWLLFVTDLAEPVLQISSYVFYLVSVKPDKRFGALR